MKANRSPRRARPAITAAVLLASVTVTLAGCVAPGEAPSAPVSPRPAARAPASPVAAPLAADWRDRPQTPGDWTWRKEPGGSRAQFGGVLTVACLQPGQVRLVVPQHDGPLTIRTTSVTRAIARSALVADRDQGRADQTFDLPADDPLLDAMAFSRGRFAIDSPAGPSMTIPSWSELGRVIEDCREPNSPARASTVSDANFLP